MNFFRKVGGALEKFSKYDPLVGANPIRKKYFKGLNKGIADYMDPDGMPDPSERSYTNPFTGEEVKYRRGGKVKKFAKGGSMDDLAPRGNLPDKNAAEQAREAKRKKPKQEDDLTPYENLPPKKFAKGGKVRGDGCCVKGKTKGRFR